MADGKGFTYHAHPDLACWKGRLYLAWGSSEKDEDAWPSRELYSTSVDGKTWSPPVELFPQGTSTPLRMYFYLAKNGRMLAVAGLRTFTNKKVTERSKDGMVVREILANHTLGKVCTLHQGGTVPETNIPDRYMNSGDRGFVAACHELLDNHVFLEQQDHGVMHVGKEMKWHDRDAWRTARNADAQMDFGKAISFYRRKDGARVAVGMHGVVTVSKDEGKTWSEPARPPTLPATDGKIWGQRTADNRYALAYIPSTSRLPIAVASSDDGITFSNMAIVFNEEFPVRYEGLKKGQGVHHIRGISEWASDNSRKEQVMWLTFSVNKEDIWVSQIPLPIKGK